MAEEAWLSGKLDGYSPILMPTAHALVQAITDLQRYASDLTDEELFMRPNGASSAAFHLRHIAGSIDRLLTYARGENLTETQFDFLKEETSESSNLNAKGLTLEAIEQINKMLEFLKTVSPDSLFEERFVGRKKLQTNVFGLLFHIAEHTARHVGQLITTVKIVKNRN